jgi:hypothetical protein
VSSNKKNPVIKKKVYKKQQKRCKICGANIYEILNVHRIIPGEKQGSYRKENVVCICHNCHDKHHAGLIKIHGWVDATCGRLLNYTDADGVEHFV